MDGQKLRQFISDAQEARWAPREVREQFQAHEVDIIPANFYSSIPTLSEIDSSFEYSESGEPPYLNPSIFNAATMREDLIDLIPYAADFKPPVEGDPETARSFFWNNGQFGHCDAPGYYAMLRRAKPRTVVEIGSGFSSLAALEALRKNGAGNLVCIEPYPRPFLEALAADGELTLRRELAQTVDNLNDTLADGDVLFIDSTHTVKIGSDCLHIYLRLLPSIKRKILVHVHDIFLPFGMPPHWARDNHIYWTEQYLLLAFLLDNPKVKVLFGSAYHGYANADLLETFMQGQAPAGGGSFWFEYDGTK